MIETNRKEKRYSAIHPVEVTCRSWDHFRQLYTHNISRGGCFLRTPEPAPTESNLSVQFSLPRGHRLTLEAKVVHAITADRASSEGRQPGMGVRFIGMDESKQRLIQALMELAQLDQGAASVAGQSPAPAAKPSTPPPIPAASSRPAPPVPPAVPGSKTAAPAAPPPIPAPIPAAREISSDELFDDLSGNTPIGEQPIISAFLIESAQEHLEKQHYQKAAQAFEQIVASEPQNQEARLGLLLAQGLRLAQEGRAQQAAAKLQEVLQQRPDHPRAAAELRKLDQGPQQHASSGRGMMGRLLKRK